MRPRDLGGVWGRWVDQGTDVAHMAQAAHKQVGLNHCPWEVPVHRVFGGFPELSSQSLRGGTS